VNGFSTVSNSESGAATKAPLIQGRKRGRLMAETYIDFPF
jgi:hypothetical protein